VFGGSYAVGFLASGVVKAVASIEQLT